MSECSPAIAVRVLDWDHEELDLVRAHGLKYTVRSSKYPRTIRNPRRIILVLNDAHAWDIHTVLLARFSGRISAMLKGDASLEYINIDAFDPIGCAVIWDMFLTWLYTFDKVPLPDFTPLRPPGWRSQDIVSAFFLSSFLRAPLFEKYLLRIIMKDLYEGRFPERSMAHLAARMPPDTGTHHFTNAWLRWKDSGWAGELDPYRWRVEHWYSICGRLGNWGCFHAMNVSGWRGVWQRQKALEVGWIDETTDSEEED